MDILGGAYQLVDSVLETDPRMGPSLRQLFRGDPQALGSLRAAYYVAGWKTSLRTNGGIADLVVNIPQYNDGKPEVPVDTYDWGTEFVQSSIWKNPKIVASSDYLGIFPDGEGNDITLSSWKAHVVHALKGFIPDSASTRGGYKEFAQGNSGPLTPDEAGFSTNGIPPNNTAAQTLYAIYMAAINGIDSFEDERFWLKRTRTMSAAYEPKEVIDPIMKVYSTAKLTTTFLIPSSVAAKLPATPVNKPYNTVWGWKMRQNNSQFIPAFGKIHETKDWLFAAWSRLIYTIIE